MNEFGNVGDRKYMYARIEQLEAELKEAEHWKNNCYKNCVPRDKRMAELEDENLKLRKELSEYEKHHAYCNFSDRDETLNPQEADTNKGAYERGPDGWSFRVDVEEQEGADMRKLEPPGNDQPPAWP